MARVSATLLGAALAVLCRQPGFRRAGQAHPARAEYPPGHFTEEQLEAMAAEPMLQLLPIEIDEGAGAAPSTGMPGRSEGEGPLAPVDPSAVSVAAPAAATEAEPIKEAEEGAVSSEGQAATPGDEAAEAAGASTDAPGPAGDNQAAPPAQEGGAVSGDAAPAAPAPAAQAPKPARRGRG